MDKKTLSIFKKSKIESCKKKCILLTEANLLYFLFLHNVNKMNISIIY